MCKEEASRRESGIFCWSRVIQERLPTNGIRLHVELEHVRYAVGGQNKQ